MADFAGVQVGILMGSDSDLEVMAQAEAILASLGVATEILVVSAHRTPALLVEYTRAARGRGLQVLVAGAGGAAHLPGMVASMTTLPVVGVPIQTKAFQGLDSLLSIVQMPAGIPVATVAVNGGTNAGLLAARILASHDSALADRLQAYADRLEADVLAKSDKLRRLGGQAYLKLQPENS
ncbi:MAG: 5-(carboxyamino)imidazole ribonucleotide mutase [Spirochaetales bacterium]